MKRLILHWTAGAGQPNNTDYEHYHYLVNKDGLLFQGKYKVKDNENCNDGVYAQHCGGGNTGAIGVSMCGMAGFNGVATSTKYPLTKVQCEATFNLCAKLCKQYGLLVTPETVMTHYEFGQKHPKTSSYGKIDIIYLPPYPEIKKAEIGDFIRNKIKWYYSKL